MKTSIYELLGLIKEGKAPKKIKVTGNIYEYDESYKHYFTRKKGENYAVMLGGMINEINLIADAFNDNVEIIEEDKELKKIDSYICNVGAVNNFNDVEKYIHRLFEQQAQLIQNQNKIIEKLKNK